MMNERDEHHKGIAIYLYSPIMDAAPYNNRRYLTFQNAAADYDVGQAPWVVQCYSKVEAKVEIEITLYPNHE